jgi:hypothetical protein
MPDNVLYRYTDLPALIYLLKEEAITLIDPQSWDDKNDSHFFQLYKQKKKLKTVLALCFTQQGETYHHWRVFAQGSSGVRIEFWRPKLLAAVKKQSGLRTGSVRYLTIDKINRKPIKIASLPFLKRHAFKPENEFRLVFESKTDPKPSLNIPIPFDCISRITLSPWMHPSLDTHLKEVIRSLLPRAQVVRSTLISNVTWKKAGDSAK